MLRLALVLLLSLNACWSRDETLAGYAGMGSRWVLIEIDGKPVRMAAEISFVEAERLGGHGPCNTFGSAITAPYPWFGLGPIDGQKRACAELAQERAFLDALTSMTLAEVHGDTLILSDENGRQMVFFAQN